MSEKKKAIIFENLDILLRRSLTRLLSTENCFKYQIMPLIILLKVRKYLKPTANRFGTAREKPVSKGKTCKVIILLKVRKYLKPTANRFGTAREKPVRGGGGHIE